jgi:molybdopterin converting factor small subunit
MRRARGSRSAATRRISAITDASPLRVRLACFARIRELVGAAQLERTVPAGTTAAACLAALAAEFPALAPLAASTRFVRGGTFVGGEAELRDGDELGLLPPYGGG